MENNVQQPVTADDMISAIRADTAKYGRTPTWAEGIPPAEDRVMMRDLNDPAPITDAEPECCDGTGLVDLGAVTAPCAQCGWCACGDYVTAGFPHSCSYAAVTR